LQHPLTDADMGLDILGLRILFRQPLQAGTEAYTLQASASASGRQAAMRFPYRRFAWDSFGHCCYCGTDNEVQICAVCSSPFGDGEGSGGLCNGCIAKIEKNNDFEVHCH